MAVLESRLLSPNTGQRQKFPLALLIVLEVLDMAIWWQEQNTEGESSCTRSMLKRYGILKDRRGTGTFFLIKEVSTLREISMVEDLQSVTRDNHTNIYARADIQILKHLVFVRVKAYNSGDNGPLLQLEVNIVNIRLQSYVALWLKVQIHHQSGQELQLGEYMVSRLVL